VHLTVLSVVFTKGRINEEIAQLLLDIGRIGGGSTVEFGQLFDDDEVQQYYEALVG
jgi:hypothetical protein